jgi:hypothetical protein
MDERTRNKGAQLAYKKEKPKDGSKRLHVKRSLNLRKRRQYVIKAPASP